MPSISNSYNTVAEQIISYNNNIVDILNKINSVTSTNEPTVNVEIKDSTGASTNVSLPSFSYIQNEINRLNNNINSLFGLNNNSAVIQTTSNSFQRIVAVDLNLEPKDINSLSIPRYFTAKKNYMFDSLMDPQLSISFDLTGKINSDIKDILVRKYITEFEKDEEGNLTNNGISALNSFNSTFKGQTNILLEDYLVWQQTTPGILYPSQPRYAEEIHKLDPNQLQYHGVFSVLKSEIDANNILWYYIDTLTYTEILTNKPKQLAINDSLIINIEGSNTIYKISQISNSSSNPKLNLTRISGNQPIPPGVATLKIYSPMLKNNNVKIPVGYDEYHVTFIKALNTTNYLLSKNWSFGVGYYTNELVLKSNNSYNGQSMLQYYTNEVSDYGLALKDLINKIPVAKGVSPLPPTVVADNFKVIQTNGHLTETPDVTTIKEQASQISNLNSQAEQLASAIATKNKQLQVTRFTSEADRKQYINELNSLENRYNSISALKNSINNQILNSDASKIKDVKPLYAIRGFWDIPSPSLTASTAPQEIVKFEVQYKKLNRSGSEAPVETYKLSATASNKAVAVYSNWTNLETTYRKRKYDKTTDQFKWVLEDQSDPEVININQLNIPIEPNEVIQIRIRSISEVGFPDSPIESEWSDIVSVEFPEGLNQVPNAISTIVSNAQAEGVKNQLMESLNNKGLNDLLNQKVVINNTTYYLTSEKILSGYKDENGNAIDLLSYLQELTSKVATLQSLVDNAQGKLAIYVYNNSSKYKVEKNTILNFTVNCEDYLENISGNTIVNNFASSLDSVTSTQRSLPTGRVYANKIYLVKDFYMTIENTSATNALGLLSNVTYTSGVNSDVYNNGAPQVFWTDDQHNLITSDVTGSTKTQLDNQFLWSVNYDSVDQTTVTKLSDDVGNLFASEGNNSITNVLSSNEYNVGYADPSILSFVGNNNSLLDMSKWIDTTNSISSTNKLLSTVHPSVQELTAIQETNSAKVHNINSNNSINIPLNIYFKMNALDPSKEGNNYQYVVLNGVSQNVRHVKKLKFTLYNQADNSPFTFTIIFTINRVNVIQQKTFVSSPSQLAQTSGFTNKS